LHCCLMGVMYFRIFWQLIQSFIGIFGGDLWGRALILFSWWVLLPSCDIGKTVLLLAFIELGGYGIQRTISEQVAVLMALPASKGYVFVVDCLVPVFVLVFKRDGTWQGFRYVHIDADTGIWGVLPHFCSFWSFDISSHRVSDAHEYFFQPEFLG